MRFAPIVWILTIIAVIFGLMALAYGLGGWLEAAAADPSSLLFPVLWRGVSHLTNMLVLMLAFVMVMATLLTIAERKWSALMQDRIGPNRARFPGLQGFALGGIPHIAGDVLKMLTKEAFTPRSANGFLFNLAPMLAFAPVFALFAIVPAGPTVQVLGQPVMMVVANPDFGLLYLLAIASLAVYGTSLAGWASNNKFALLGGVRASSQMISYEVALGLSLVGMMLAFSTVQLAGPGGMSALQGTYLWQSSIAGIDFGVPQWGILLQPVGFILFFAAAFAETKRAPFDSPEGESEIVGYFLEYSGMQFGMFMISEFVEVVVLAGVLVAIFFGGWSLPIGNEALQQWQLMKDHPWLLGAVGGTVFWVKVVLVCYLQLVIRWSFPPLSYDQVQKLGWQMLLPAGLLNLFISGALVLFDPSLKALALMGFAQLAVIVFLTMTPPRQVRREQAAEGAHHGHHAGHPPAALSADAHGATPH
jgi:NADH-quinone oxidoreductase subunit H